MLLEDPCTDERFSYETTPLKDYLYTENCVPEGWAKFFIQQDVVSVMETISQGLVKKAYETQWDKKGKKHPKIIQPKMIYLFQAFREIKPDAVKVVIVGQDPTPTPGQATGMAFSLRKGAPPQDVPSTSNMFTALTKEGFWVDWNNGDLTKWAERGVLLLNSALTITQKMKNLLKTKKDPAESNWHQATWNQFTIKLIDFLNNDAKNSKKKIVWIFWGEKAKVFKNLVNQDQVLTGCHPHSNLRKFMDVDYFRCANHILQKINNKLDAGIDWNLAPAKTDPNINCVEKKKKRKKKNF